MKKIMIILASLILFMGVSFQAEAQTLVKADQVIHYTYGDTLIKDEVYQATSYYVKDYAATVRWQLQGDSISSGWTKLQGVLLGSLDNSNWFTVGDTIVLTANGADSDKVLYTNVFYNYLKPKVTAIDSTQNSEFNWKILIDVND